ncbi:alkaline phosphatase family protein [Homoserinibacter sp. YIM 151385]|uniref:alkaline phosphatase family protein n=1 Tax=Homoserinibacter sp. YIM 151385 TaxID=2985506 RepID=UPI0022F02ACE|nr:alkaline phosphatase family protein [Homoserinibacter sp. YIM 151385]WBU38496.1 alkaline phosphatase family protein [Homoserinibacter sp. YIM 151385]
MLPATSTHRFSLADVMPNCLSALSGEAGPLGLPPVEHAVVLLVDGLGERQLRERSAHARTLAGALGPRSAIGSGFPTTTASAIATLTTGERPGRHGLFGYEVLDPARDRVVNQLSGWDAGMAPERWQPVATVFERATAHGIRALAIGPARYADSGFTRAVLRGAEYLPAASIADRLARAAAAIRRPGRSLVYVYVPELDVIAHRAGVDSAEWVAALEALDGEVRQGLHAYGPGRGLLVTADHGILDIPAEAQIVLEPALLEGVRHVAGEPRALQLHLEAGADAASLMARLAARLGKRAWVASREELVASGALGEIDRALLPRLGEVLVIARTRIALYVDPESRGRGMIGQHGALSPEETAVPLLRFGAFA